MELTYEDGAWRKNGFLLSFILTKVPVISLTIPFLTRCTFRAAYVPLNLPLYTH